MVRSRDSRRPMVAEPVVCPAGRSAIVRSVVYGRVDARPGPSRLAGAAFNRITGALLKPTAVSMPLPVTVGGEAQSKYVDIFRGVILDE